jgi:hypothetical protein
MLSHDTSCAGRSWESSCLRESSGFRCQASEAETGNGLGLGINCWAANSHAEALRHSVSLLQPQELEDLPA